MRKRQGIHETYLNVAAEIAKRSTCARREVGCVLVDENRRIKATGHNGVPAGQPHCINTPCEGTKFKSGEGLDSCLSIHAEINALLNCPDPFSIYSAYLTVSPCKECLKVLMNTSLVEIHFLEEYVHEGIMERWLKSKGPSERRWVNWEMGRVFWRSFSEHTGFSLRSEDVDDYYG